MPALITHDFFGHDVYDDLYKSVGGTRNEADAFMLGNQGPDPLFYSVIDPKLRAVSRLGSTMHNEKPSELLAALKASLSILDEEEYAIGHAYALGFLCHYTLDATMHPFVYFQEYRLLDAGEPGLSRDDDNEVHGTIESEFDEMVLFTKRGETVATFEPWREILQASPFVLDTISKMYSYLALTVYGLIIPTQTFASSVRGFRTSQKLFHSPGGTKRRIIGKIEQMVRPYSFFQAMSHRPVELTESIFGNHEHERWECPFTGTKRTLSFWDLYDEAKHKAKENIELFDQDSFDLELARTLTEERDFSGRPVVATLVSVENHPTSAPGATTSSTPSA